MTPPVGEGEAERIEQILSVVMELAAGNLNARGEQTDRADALDALVCGINMLAEEIARRFAVTEQLTAELADEKERTIRAQQATIRELSTPAIELWPGVLLVSLIGTIDTLRARDIAERTLATVAAKQATVLLLDVTGVAVVDTAVANHLFNTIDAARLLGAKGILTGISPTNAQTLARLGVDLSRVMTKGTLQTGLQAAFQLIGTTGPGGAAPNRER